MRTPQFRLETGPDLGEFEDEALHRSIARQLLDAGSGLGVSAPPVDIDRFRVAMNEPDELNALVDLRIPMMPISQSDLMPISSERSDAGLLQCELVIDIRQDFSCVGFVFH